MMNQEVMDRGNSADINANPQTMGMAQKLAAQRAGGQVPAPAGDPKMAAVAEQIKPLLASAVKAMSDVMAILGQAAGGQGGA